MKIRFLFLLIICGIVVGASPAQPSEKNRIDSLFAEWNRPDTPGAAVGVIKDGKLIYANGYGMGDLEHNILITPKSVFYLASLSKQFTAISILLLEEQGKLSLDDEIQKFLPDFPRYSSPIRVRHLVHHTSGLRDFSTLMDLQGKNYLDHVPEQDVYELIKRQKALNFSPDEEYLYSNSGYFLLGKIVEKVSGQRLKDFAGKNIFAPLGMKSTLFLDDVRQVVKNRVFSYERNPSTKEFSNVIRRYDLVGSGGVYSNIEDLYLWDQNFYHNKLGKGGQEIINKMHQEGIITKGPRSGYAFGIVNGTYKGVKRVGHSGSNASFRTHLSRFPDNNLSVIVLANRSDANATSKLYEVADVFLPQQANDARGTKAAGNETRNPVKLNAEELSKFTGFYLNNRDNSLLSRVIIQDGVLQYSESSSAPTSLIPLGNADFKMADSSGPGIIVRFDNLSRTMSVLNGGSVRSTSSGYVINSFSIDEKRPLEGTYYSTELNTLYDLKLRDNALTLIVNGRETSSLTPISADILHSASYGAFYFEKDTSGGITGFKLNINRIRDLQFTKR